MKEFEARVHVADAVQGLVRWVLVTGMNSCRF